MQPFHLRTATPEDIPAIQALIDASVRGLSVGYYTPAEIDSALLHIFGPDTALIDDGTYCVIESDGQLAASGGWSRRRTLYGGDQMKSGHDAYLNPAHDSARIRAFFVHPGFARRGLGRMLFEWCSREAWNAGFRQFELGATLPGVPLYSTLGFTEVDRIRVPTPDGVGLPVVHMARTVPEPRT